MFIAKDLIQFKNLFVNQLKNMLSDDELGAFILVLANSQQDQSIKNELQENIKNTLVALKNNFATGHLNATQDDIDVFKQLLDDEAEEVLLWQRRSAGAWEISCNPMRKLRPARTSSQRLRSIRLVFDDKKFHFNKGFLEPEILWQGVCEGVTMRVLYNKFPFSDYHLLITISPEKKHPQLLTHESHQTMSALALKVANRFPGFGVGYNSLAAGASVNHLHFQGFIRDDLFPVENTVWKHNAGDVEYPLMVKRFSDVEICWQFISELIEKDIAFNCLYRKNYCYVMPRAYQGTVDLPGWLQGAGWLDVAGVITVPDKETFDCIDESSVTQALGLLSQYN